MIIIAIIITVLIVVIIVLIIVIVVVIIVAFCGARFLQTKHHVVAEFVQKWGRSTVGELDMTQEQLQDMLCKELPNIRIPFSQASSSSKLELQPLGDMLPPPAPVAKASAPLPSPAAAAEAAAAATAAAAQQQRGVKRPRSPAN